METTRQEGYYWVKVNDVWMVAFWNGDMFIGDVNFESAMEHSVITKITPFRIDNPDESDEHLEGLRAPSFIWKDGKYTPA